jgi:hypothetical protein
MSSIHTDRQVSAMSFPQQEALTKKIGEFSVLETRCQTIFEEGDFSRLGEVREHMTQMQSLTAEIESYAKITLEIPAAAEKPSASTKKAWQTFVKGIHQKVSLKLQDLETRFRTIEARTKMTEAKKSFTSISLDAQAALLVSLEQQATHLFSEDLDFTEGLIQLKTMHETSLRSSEIERLSTSIASGEPLTFSHLQSKQLSTTEVLTLLHTASETRPEGIKITLKDGYTITFKVAIKSSLKKGGAIISSLNESPGFETFLQRLEDEGGPFYEINIIDDQRPPVDPALLEAETKIPIYETILNKIRGLYGEYAEEDTIPKDVWNAFTPEEIEILSSIDERFGSLESITKVKIDDLLIPHQPVKEALTDARILLMNTPIPDDTMVLRGTTDGSFAELSTLVKQSGAISGNKLVQIAGKFFALTKTQHAYLHDDANITHSEGRYPLRIFRYFTTPDKSSWYTDSHQYKPFKYDPESSTFVDCPEDPAKTAIAPFKTRTTRQVRDDLSKIDITTENKEKLLALLEEFRECTTMQEIGEQLSRRSRTETGIPGKLKTLLETYVTMYRGYEGEDPELLALKEQTQILKDTEFYRKSFR